MNLLDLVWECNINHADDEALAAEESRNNGEFLSGDYHCQLLGCFFAKDAIKVCCFPYLEPCTVFNIMHTYVHI